MADFLANVALKVNDITLKGVSEMEIKVRPSVLDNLYNWQVFHDDNDLLKLLHYVDHYQAQAINFSDFVEMTDGKETLLGQEIIQLKSNKIPRGLVALERAFKIQDKVEIKGTSVKENDVE